MACDRLIVESDDAEREDRALVEQRRDDSEHKRDDRDNDDAVVVARAWSSAAAAPVSATAAEHDDYSDDTDLEEEMMRIDPNDVEWRRQLHVGDPVDAQNVFGNWCPALILRIADGDVQVRYLNMNDAWHRWVPRDSGQLAQPATKTRNDSFPVRLAQQIEVRKTVHGAWKEALVVRSRPSDVHVRYAGRQQQFDDWIPFTPATVAPLGEHVRPRRSLAAAQARQLSVAPSRAHRRRVFASQTPRYEHYRSALERDAGLRIVPVEGDGNCLFRSVSHQVYGDDRHHAVVRAMCMDYMESEQEYFEPYVVGDMAAFLRYLSVKRRDGVWGDDPELQAMCELYDRPAEVYAYDPTLGYRKLRTFHETSSVSRSRPPIRLSYYGGGHYDSLVGLDHAANCIHDVPGEWERRHIAYSHRINTRSGGADHPDDETTTGVVRQVAAESDLESTEMAQLEQTLALSRHEFDAMHASLDETLKRSLEESESAGRETSDAEQLALRAATRESEMAALQAELIANAKQASEEELVKHAIEASLETLPPGAHDAAFDEQVSAAIQASLGHFAAPSGHDARARAAPHDYDDEMQRVLALSAHEYDRSSSSTGELFQSSNALAAESDDDDELQRAIQASLLQS